MYINYVKNALETRKARSAWDRGVNEYALDMLTDLEIRIDDEGRTPDNPRELAAWLLCGAQDWTQYSESGFALIWNLDIAKRLCSPSELKRLTNKNGSLKDRPNPRETWLECQARALRQAATLIYNTWPLYPGSSAKGGAII